MTLKEWLETRSKPYDPARALALTIATDGLSHDKSTILAVGMNRIGEPPVVLYVRGGDVAANANFTVINPDTFALEAVQPERAAEVVRQTAENAEFIIAYTVRKFLQGWIDDDRFAWLVPLRELEALDLFRYIQLREARQLPDPAVQRISELETYISRTVGDGSKGYGYEATYSRVVGPSNPVGPVFARRLPELLQLYQILLMS